MNVDVAVLGVGAAGEVAALLLASQKGIDRLRIADVRKGRLEHVASRIDCPVEAVRADFGKKEGLRKACRGADVLLNASIPMYNEAIMQESLRIGSHYLDLASEGSPDPKQPSRIHAQLRLDEEFRRIDRVAILGLGVAPGLTNLLTRLGTEPMDRIDAIRIRVYGSGYAHVSDHVFAPLFSPETFLEEVLWPAPVWKDDHNEKLPPFSGEETFLFPEPIGPAICFNVNNEECETMPLILGKGVRFVDFKYAIAPPRKALLEALYRLGLTGREPIEVKGQKVVPLDVLLALLPDPSSLADRAEGYTCVVVEVEGLREGRAVSARYWTCMSHADAYARLGVQATAFLTGAPPAATVDALLSGAIERRGVTTGGGLNPVPILRRAMALGVPLFEGPIGSAKGKKLVV